MTLEYKQSLTELNTIIHYMDIDYFKKLPLKFIEFVNLNMDKEYKPNIDKNIPINEQNLKKNTQIILSLLYRNYWCNAEKKEELVQNDIKEKLKYEENIKEKYNIDNLFKNKNKNIEMNSEQTEIVEKTTSLVEYKKQRWYQKIFTKIINFFKRR